MSASEDPAFAPVATGDDAAIFVEAWHAQVLALAFTLSQSGLFTPRQWSDALGKELRDAVGRGAPDDRETYYAAALAALERLVAAGGDISPAGLSERVETWRRAYLNTPHGKPVELAAGRRAPD